MVAAGERRRRGWSIIENGEGWREVGEESAVEERGPRRQGIRVEVVGGIGAVVAGGYEKGGRDDREGKWASSWTGALLGSWVRLPVFAVFHEKVFS